MKDAFTLIELLVVIAIIAMLAAILFPVFAQAKRAAKEATDLSTMGQLGKAAALYKNDFDDCYQLLGSHALQSAIPRFLLNNRTSPVLGEWQGKGKARGRSPAQGSKQETISPEQAKFEKQFDRYRPYSIWPSNDQYFTWALLLMPYIRGKVDDLDVAETSFMSRFDDLPDPFNHLTGLRRTTRFMSYGFNYTCLNRFEKDADRTLRTEGIADSNVPGNAIVFASRTSSQFLSYEPLYSLGNRTPLNIGQVEAPGAWASGFICMSGWGFDSQWIKLGVVDAGTNGASTGLVAAPYQYSTFVVLQDTTAKRLPFNRLVEGTNFRPGISQDDLHILRERDAGYDKDRPYRWGCE